MNFKISLSKSEIDLSEKLRELIDNQLFSSFNQKELIDELNISENLFKRILKLEIDNHNLILVNGNLIFSKKNINKLIEGIKNHFSYKRDMDIGEFKKIANTSRKYAVPLLEYFDKCGLTYRCCDFFSWTKCCITVS